MAFINTLALADAPEVSCGRNLFTDGQIISVQTSHPDKLGIINIIKGNSAASSSEELNVDQAYKIFTASDLSPQGSQIVLANDGISISGDGLFSFDSSQMIDPRIKEVDANFNADIEGIDYVLSSYVPPTKQGDWLSATANFDLSNVFRVWDKYYFIISVPGLTVDDGTSDKVRIKEMKVDLTGTSLGEKLNKFFKK
jgi:hypothetical protein